MFLRSARVMAKPDGAVEQRQSLRQNGVCILCAVKSLLEAIDWMAVSPGLHVDFSSIGFSMQLNGFFLNSGVHGMLEGKNFCAVNMIFLIIGAYADRATGS